MMPVFRAAATALVGLAVVPAVAPAATQADDASASTPKDQGVGTSSGGLYALFPDPSSTDLEASEFLDSLEIPGGATVLSRGAFLGKLAPAPGDPGTPTANAAATNGQASARAGVGGHSRAFTLALAFAVTLLLVVGLLSAPFTSAAQAKLPEQFLGVTAEDVYVGSDAYQATNFARQSKVGFRTVRQVFRWNEIEPAPGIFDFSATDRFVLASARAGIRVMPLLFGEPAWATSRPIGDTKRITYPPIDVNRFATFAAAIVQRYGSRGTLWAANPALTPVPILTYQLWNEPNLPFFWGGKVNPAGYARLLAAAAPAIRALQPEARIVSGGLPLSSLGMKPAAFLKRFVKAGGGKSVDAIGIHPYALKVPAVLQQTRRLRTQLNTTKQGKKLGLWVTELGWAAGGPKTKGRTVTAKQQSALVAASFRTLAKNRKALKLQGVVYFAWRDLPPYPGRSDFWGLRTGLINLAGKDKPAVKALTKTIKGLR